MPVCHSTSILCCPETQGRCVRVKHLYSLSHVCLPPNNRMPKVVTPREHSTWILPPRLSCPRRLPPQGTCQTPPHPTATTTHTHGHQVHKHANTLPTNHVLAAPGPAAGTKALGPPSLLLLQCSGLFGRNDLALGPRRRSLAFPWAAFPPFLSVFGSFFHLSLWAVHQRRNVLMPRSQRTSAYMHGKASPGTVTLMCRATGGAALPCPAIYFTSQPHTPQPHPLSSSVSPGPPSSTPCHQQLHPLLSLPLDVITKTLFQAPALGRNCCACLQH